MPCNTAANRSRRSELSSSINSMGASTLEYMQQPPAPKLDENHSRGRSAEASVSTLRPRQFREPPATIQPIAKNEECLLHGYRVGGRHHKRAVRLVQESTDLAG